MSINEMPKNIELEQALLGELITNSFLINRVKGTLKVDDFYLMHHQTIYKVLCEMNDNEMSIDLVTFIAYIKTRNLIEKCNSISYVSDLATNSISSENVEEYANIIKELSSRRKLIVLGKKLVVDSASKDISKLINSTEDELYTIAQDKKENSIVSIKDALTEALEKMEENYKNNGNILGETTGYRDIDKTIGGLVKGDFIVVAARPSMGKTAFALNIGQYASKNSKVAMFSLEMTTNQLTNRLISARCLIEFEKIKTGKLSDEEFAKIMKGSSELTNRNIVIEDNATTLNDIVTKCTNIKIKQGLDVVIIDYLQLIEVSERTSSREQEIAKVSRTLKKLAKKLNITIIALSQLSRAVEQRADHRPTLSDLRESGAIEQDADIIMMLYRDEYYNKESERKGIAEVIINKNRNGEVKTINLAWIGQYQRFATLDYAC